MEIFGTVFCGLGLFFAGIRLISRNLRQLTGSRFKLLIQRATSTRLLSAATGFFSGVVSQSAVASVFITTGFHSAGMLTFRQSMIIINWANIGTSMLIFIVILNVKLLILYFIGIIGLAYFLQLDKTIRQQVMLQFFLGLSLLFLGVLFIKTGAGQMQSLTWFRDALQMSSGSVALLLLAGILLTVAAQSGPTVSVVALSLASVGLLSLLQTFVVVLGTGIGSAVNILVLSLKMKGSGKQLCLYQGIFKITGVITVTLLLLLDHLCSTGGEPRLLSVFSNNPGKQVAWLFLIMQLLPAILLTIVAKPLIARLKKISPPTGDERMSQPEFLNEPALNEPATALYLAEKEQFRLMRFLPDYLTPVSPDRDIKPVHNQQMLHDSFILVNQKIEQCLEKLLNKQEAAGFQESILQVRYFSTLLRGLESNLDEFVAIISSSFETITIHPMAINLVESLRTILDTAIDNFENPDAAGMEIMLSLTADKGDLLQRIRREYFQKNAAMEISVGQSVFTMTLLFDRVCSLLRSMTLIRKRDLPENVN